MPLDFRFLDLPKKVSSKEIIIATIESRPRKICFSSTHKTSLKKNPKNDFTGTFSVPFDDTIKPIFEAVTGSRLFLSEKYGNYWCFIKSMEDFEIINTFFKEYEDIVFLKDNLDLSIALGENFKDEERTYIGNLEYKAKYNNNEEATAEIIIIVSNWINKLPFYKKVDFVCAVPPSKKNDDNLPRQVVRGLAGFDFEDISKKIFWTEDKEALKGVKSSKKYDILEKAGITINCNIQNKVILLIDDLYQSGVTLQYLAHQLKLAGASKVFGISIVKSRRNTDNI